MTTTTIERDRQQRVAAAESYVRTRFYPPLPYQYGEYAVQAVEACNEGDETREILLDPELEVHPSLAERHESGAISIRAGELVDVLRLWHMIEEPCEECGGTGYYTTTQDTGYWYGVIVERETCPTCEGSGMV
jgi:hypothetical protein